MIVCSGQNCQTSAGCQCGQRFPYYPPQVPTKTAGGTGRGYLPQHSPLLDLLAAERAAGRLAGMREAAEVVAAVITIPGDEIRTDDMMRGIAKGARYTAEQNKAAILALAEGEEG